MQFVKKLLMFTIVFMVSVSVAFAAMTTEQIKEKLEQGLAISEVLELAIISGATLDDVYAAAETATVPDGSSAEQLKAQITTSAVTIAAAQDVGSTSPLAVLTISQVVEASAVAGVPLTVAMTAAATPDVKNLVSSAAVVLATRVANDADAGAAPVISVQDVAAALLATGTDESALDGALADAGATTEQVAAVEVAAAAEQAAAEQPAAQEAAAEVVTEQVVEAPVVEDPVVEEPPAPANECDTSVSPAVGNGC